MSQELTITIRRNNGADEVTIDMSDHGNSASTRDKPIAINKPKVDKTKKVTLPKNKKSSSSHANGKTTTATKVKKKHRDSKKDKSSALNIILKFILNILTTFKDAISDSIRNLFT